MNKNDDLTKLVDNVHALQQDMAHVGTVVGRLDVTIEKLTEVSLTVSQLLAVQGNRIEFHEKESEKFQKLLETRRQEQEVHIKDVYNRIEKVEAGLQSDISSTYEKVATKIESMLKDNDDKREKFNKELNDRLSRLEKWIWTLGGVGLVAVWLINNVDKFNFLT